MSCLSEDVNSYLIPWILPHLLSLVPPQLLLHRTPKRMTLNSPHLIMGFSEHLQLSVSTLLTLNQLPVSSPSHHGYTRTLVTVSKGHSPFQAWLLQPPRLLGLWSALAFHWFWSEVTLVCSQTEACSAPSSNSFQRGQMRKKQSQLAFTKPLSGSLRGCTGQEREMKGEGGCVIQD